jgi:hypothetical protein
MLEHENDTNKAAINVDTVIRGACGACRKSIRLALTASSDKSQPASFVSEPTESFLTIAPPKTPMVDR